MELLGVAIVLLIVFGPPLIALVVAIRAAAAARRLRTEVIALRTEVESLRTGLPTSGGEAPQQVGVDHPARVSEVAAAGVDEAPPARAIADGAAGTPPPGSPVAVEPILQTPPPQPPPSAPSRLGLEERFGARLPVWIGAVALALAGAFLVKYSVDEGLISPTVRVALGLLFGVVLLGAGELLRSRSAHISHGLSAAGVADLFVVFYAATDVYELLPTMAGLGLMALVTAVAVALSLRQGAIVAVVGLVGGFLTPQLVGPRRLDEPLLFAYLLLLEVGLLAVTRRRRWPLLAAANLVAALVWALAIGLEPHGPASVIWAATFVLVTAAAFASATIGRWSGDAWRPGPARLLAAAALGGSLVVMAALVADSGYRWREWVALGVLASGCLVAARLREALFSLAPVAAAAVTAMLIAWLNVLGTADAPRFVAIAFFGLALFAGGSWLARAGAERPLRWATTAAAAAIVFDLVAYAGARSAGLTLPWGAIQLGLGALAVVAALPVARARARDAAAEGSLAAVAVAATTLLSLALPMELERQWLTVGLALELVALTWLAGRLRVPVLARLAALAAVAVGVRLLLNPAVLDYATGGHPLLHWVQYGYGVPTVALGCAAALARRGSRPRLAEGLGLEAIAVATAWLALQARLYFHPADPGVGRIGVAEAGTLSIAWLLFALLLTRVATVRPWPELRLGAGAVTLLSVAGIGLLQGLAANPALAHLPVGATPVANAVAWSYALPALLLAAVAAALVRSPEPAAHALLPRIPVNGIAAIARVAALVVAFAAVTLIVRQTFRGPYLDGGSASEAEGWSYSAAWVLFGTALLVAGVIRGRRGFRFASLAVMVLAVAKVFLFDMARLSDLYRVFSFLGLGVSLLLLAFVYQRFVFQRRQA